jgi:hypothetical protein
MSNTGYMGYVALSKVNCPAQGNQFLAQLRCGQPKVLRKSQVYPLGYGRAVRKHHMMWMVPWLLTWAGS